VLFCDVITDSIQALLDLTNYRRSIQEAYNKEHGITPHSASRHAQTPLRLYDDEPDDSSRVAEDHEPTIEELEKEMKQAAAHLEFERAAMIRDQIIQLKAAQNQQSQS
jgi:excinuclease ABC subunit B